MKRLNATRILALAAVLAITIPAVAQTTMTVVNSTAIQTSIAVYETYPTKTATQIYPLLTDQSVDTKLPANGNTILSLSCAQNSADVANTPLLLTNVKKANLTNNCFSGIPPCLQCTPAGTQTPGVKAANLFLAERSTTKESCLSGTLSSREGTRYFALENGLVVQLGGALEKVAESGKTCLCGVLGTPPAPLDTILFEVRSVCEKRPRLKKH